LYAFCDILENICIAVIHGDGPGLRPGAVRVGDLNAIIGPDGSTIKDREGVGLVGGAGVGPRLSLLAVSAAVPVKLAARENAADFAGSKIRICGRCRRSRLDCW